MSQNLSDSQLSAALSTGSVDAFGLLYERYHRAVYANVLKLVQRTEYAEDLLQDVFVSLWQNRFKIRSDQSVGGWLFVVSYNKALSFLKKKVNESLEYVGNYEAFEQVVPEESVDEEHYTSQLAMVEEAVNALPARKRQVFRLCRFEGRSKEEVASMMGISPDSVKDYLKQSNRAIRNYIISKYPYGTASLTVFALLAENI
ncbi:RNA polymerase sigma-70 factor, ECF subfamily [Parapedobacter composti]|uniref:RNA polymerase sigma-70 factor, ECF subfamily n=1 Tax=Parapedobacter composti TaxID=623281 RepID=A0A1I1HN75_9SPHI|nr:sigma-70 family RNA polymerase sigma factor [Parapedobacter composti]SFC25414.1 RNA polymerase sigma-70 factor, ECF subfamily [Parapedobacter composti]